MIDCPFTLNTDGLWQCPDCGWVLKLKRDKPIPRNCPASITDEDRKRMAESAEQMMGQDAPTPEQQAENNRRQAEAIEAGKQLEYSEDDIDYITTDICPACDKYKDGRCKCGNCKQSQGRSVREMVERGGSCPAMKW